MRYWDTSAIIPLLVQEEASEDRARHLAEDSLIITWWGTRIECVSALNRRLRSGDLDRKGIQQSLRLLDELTNSWAEVLPGDSIRNQAIRLLRVHPLRANDSLQLAAALITAGDTPRTLDFVCGDERLIEAAELEGLRILA